MTPEKKLQAIVEAAGECWHEWEKYESHSGFGTYLHTRCAHCLKDKRDILSSNMNPKPTDLNELFRLSKLCGLRIKLFEYTDGWYAVAVDIKERINGTPFTATQKTTPAEALLDAIYEGISK